MIEFASLLLGLLSGPIRVELAVDPTVAAVVLELDGERAAELAAPPWQAELSLDDRLRPRRLAAVALDAHGREIDRVTRLLNLDRPPGEVDYVLHRNSSGWVTMLSLAWKPRAGDSPRRTAVALDGRQIGIDDPQRIFPPPLDPARLHILEAVAEYGDGLVTRDRIGVGGPVLGDGSARLTPVMATLGETSREPQAAGVSARRVDSGQPVRVVGVERGEAEIVFVRDGDVARVVARLGPSRPTSGALSGARDAQAARVLHAVPFADDEWVRILHPPRSMRRAGAIEAHRVAVPLVSDHPGRFGLFWQLKNVDEGQGETTPVPLADAVAVAGDRAASAGRRRAVVLLLTADSRDEGSLLDPERARAYLAELGVPLEVWILGRGGAPPTAWGSAVGVRGLPGLEKAMVRLRARLETQRIIWVDGIHLPGEIEIEIGPSAQRADP